MVVSLTCITCGRGGRPGAPRRPGYWGPLRAVPCQRLVEQPWGQLFLSYVVLSDEVTVLHVTMRPASPPPGLARRGRSHSMLVGRAGLGWPGADGARRVAVVGPGLPGQLTLTDDQGTVTTAGFLRRR